MVHQEAYGASCSCCVHADLPEAVDDSATYLYQDGNDHYVKHQTMDTKAVEDVQEEEIAQQVEHIGDESLVSQL